MIRALLRGELHASTGSDFRKASISFITQDLARQLNTLPDRFFLKDRQGRKTELVAVTDPGFFQQFIIDRFVTGTYASVSTDLYETARELGSCPLIIVQTATPLDIAERAKIHDELAAQYPGMFIRFQVFPDLAGGMRIFVNGVLTDASWQNRLHRIISRIEKHSYV